ncbi:MAG: hypothetical protein JW993_00440 [Sedimentisphaerales bacterium]|nr:hypothetical protein [Sedimentisphaerales bacterium]
MHVRSVFAPRDAARAASVVVFYLLCGCGAPQRGGEIANPIFFPAAPEQPRLQFLKSFSGPADLGASGPGGFERFVLGQAEQQEGITTPYGLAIHDGKIYVCDVGTRRVKILDLRNRTFSYLTEDRRLVNPVNIFIDDDGTKYVADPTAGAVFVFDASDTLAAILGKELQISPLDVVVRGPNCYVTDYRSNQVVVLDKATGREISRIGQAGTADDQFQLISDLTFGPKGHLYVTDKLKAKVFEFDPSGKLVRTLGRLGDNIDEFVRPKGIAVDKAGRIWVVDAGVSITGSIWSTEVAKIYDQQGRLLLFFGGPGNLPGMMNLPATIVLDYDNIDLFEPYAVRGARLEFLVLVTNQYGPNKISVYGFGQFPDVSTTAASTPMAAVKEARETRTPPVTPEPRPQTDSARQQQRAEEIARLYYQSMTFYRAGHLEEARAGFVEVLESGLIPPPMEETLKRYLQDIDQRLKSGRGAERR